MPLFQIDKDKASLVKASQFPKEKELQHLIERNLETIFNCRFVATEFSTGAIHGGRIDTLALSEDNNPVIIEYKIKPSSDLINQSLFYLSWMKDHQGDFQVAVGQQLGNNIEVDEFDDHLEGKSQMIREIVTELREYILSLDESIEEAPKKFYIAYRTSQNFVCLEIQKSKVLLFLKIKAEEFEELPRNSRDVSSIGHFGTGDFEYTVKTVEDTELAKNLIQQSFANIGE